MLDNPIARQRFAREIVEASKPRDEDMDPRDVLTPFDRDIVGGVSVQLRVPLRDPVELRRHLGIIEETCRELRLRLERNAYDRTHLFMVRGVLRALNQKLNAYRAPRKE